MKINSAELSIFLFKLPFGPFYYKIVDLETNPCFLEETKPDQSKQAAKVKIEWQNFETQ